MFKPLLNLKGSSRRRQVAMARAEARQPIFNPYTPCTCDLAISYGGTTCLRKWFVPLYHDTGRTSYHLLKCPQIRTVRSKTSKRRKSPGRPTSYLGLRGEKREKSKADTRRENARRQRKEARRFRDLEARAGAMKAVNPARNPFAQCCCGDMLSDSEDEAVREEARIMCHTRADGSTTFHLPNCLTGRSDYTGPAYPTPANPSLHPTSTLKKKKEETGGAQKRRQYTRRQPKPAKRHREIPEPNATLEALKAVFNPYAECSCDLHDTEECSFRPLSLVVPDDGTTSNHLGTCAKMVIVPQPSHKMHASPAKRKPTSISKARKKKKKKERRQRGTDVATGETIQFEDYGLRLSTSRWRAYGTKEEESRFGEIGPIGTILAGATRTGKKDADHTRGRKRSFWSQRCPDVAAISGVTRMIMRQTRCAGIGACKEEPGIQATICLTFQSMKLEYTSLLEVMARLGIISDSSSAG